MNVRQTLQSTSSFKPIGNWAALIVSALALSACGGGCSIGAAEATPAGISSGTVTGFGSIVVDGIHYDDKKVILGVVTPATAPDRAASGASVEIKLGHHVELTFTGDESNSSASSVTVSAEVVGKVSAITPEIVVAGQSLRAGKRAAAVMSLVHSARLNGNDPYAYLKDVLERLPTQPASRVDELLPHRWQAP